MTPPVPTPVPHGAAPSARVLTEVGPDVGSTSLAAGSRRVVVSTPGTGDHRPG